MAARLTGSKEQAKGPMANRSKWRTRTRPSSTPVKKIAGYRRAVRQGFDPKTSPSITLPNHRHFRASYPGGNSPYDRYKAGRRMLCHHTSARPELFTGKNRCDECHEGINFSSQRLRKSRHLSDKPEPDVGRSP